MSGRSGEKVYDQQRQPLTLARLLMSGGAGSVFTLKERSGEVAKLYHADKDAQVYAPKLQAMLELRPDLPPIEESGVAQEQIVWPTGLLRDRGGRFIGFTMPLLDEAATTDLEHVLQERQARAEGLPTGLGAKMALAANLAAMLVALHRWRHYVVDLKPLNVRFYRQSLHIAMLDCDGFSIQGKGERFPAGQVTSDYLAAEFQQRGVKPGEEDAQDCFALAVIIFQLLNFGLHPYAGRPQDARVPSDLPGRIAANLYPYGRQANPRLLPSPVSSHEMFPAALRDLFDRAFSKQPSQRPSAQEWATLLLNYARRSSGQLVICSRDAGHQHFVGLPCPACARAELLTRSVQAANAVNAANAAQQVAGGKKKKKRQRGRAATAVPPVTNVTAATAQTSTGWAAQVPTALKPLRYLFLLLVIFVSMPLKVVKWIIGTKKNGVPAMIVIATLVVFIWAYNGSSPDTLPAVESPIEGTQTPENGLPRSPPSRGVPEQDMPETLSQSVIAALTRDAFEKAMREKLIEAARAGARGDLPRVDALLGELRAAAVEAPHVFVDDRKRARLESRYDTLIGKMAVLTPRGISNEEWTEAVKSEQYQKMQAESTGLLRTLWDGERRPKIGASLLTNELRSLLLKFSPIDAITAKETLQALREHLWRIRTLQEQVLVYAPLESALWQAYGGMLVDQDEELALGALVVAERAEAQPRNDTVVLYRALKVMITATPLARFSEDRAAILKSRANVLGGDVVSEIAAEQADQILPPVRKLKDGAGLWGKPPESADSTPPPTTPQTDRGQIKVNLAAAGFRPQPLGIVLPESGGRADSQMVLVLDVWKNGQITSVLVEKSSGDPALDQAARLGAADWRNVRKTPKNGERRRVAIEFKASAIP
ncbi:MAG: TonB family protein [Azonexus sp.]|jgi:TonB family protein|nr:TonB family protein [Azonexus sp.]